MPNGGRVKIHIKGGGWYGCHLAHALKGEHAVLLSEKSHRLFAGASGANPARLHMGPHYPRSARTRAACQAHAPEFMAKYGHLTRHVRHNLYAIAERDSMIDYGTYLQVLRGLPLIEVHNTAERGLRNVEGAVQVDERHIVIDLAREWFTAELANVAHYGVDALTMHEADMVIDCTFCSAPDSVVAVDRFEPCVTGILEGPCDTAVTIMDGPFPSLYPWDERRGLLSITSAKLTPLCRCPTWAEARKVLDELGRADAMERAEEMVEQMAEFYPAVFDYDLRDVLLGIRAMPASKADARLVEVAELPRQAGGPVELAIRAGKIDAVFEAERQVRERIAGMRGFGGGA